MKIIKNIYKIPLLLLAVPLVIMMRLIKPIILVRIGALLSFRIGHFAANTELYICERDALINKPEKKHIDIFFHIKPICNLQLAIMWKRLLKIWPSWLLIPINRINQFIPGGEEHFVGYNTQNDRDIHNLLNLYPQHINFTKKEIERGEAFLRKIGIPQGAPIVCLIVRDSAYLENHQPGNWNYHNYRDSKIENYELACNSLAERGIFVIRMGAKVNSFLKNKNPKIIDYATNGMRDDFMDIYFGAVCKFCISSGTGWDAIPAIVFRKPICYVNHVPLKDFCTYINNALILTKHHFSIRMNRVLTLKEIVDSEIAMFDRTSDFEYEGIKLIENTPEEIRDVVLELDDSLNGVWIQTLKDDELQLKFWKIYMSKKMINKNGQLLHGKIYAKYSSNFLRNHSEWLHI
jgi:putative glycosyltransferase (TIGR04372 family)